MKKILAMLLAVMMAAGLAACGGNDGNSDDPAGNGSGNSNNSGSGTDSGKYLSVMLSTGVMSLDTNLAADGESFEVIADCIDGLTQMDAEGAAIPAVAESWDVSGDGLTYTFHLRDARWANGDPVTANDFVFAWRLGVETNKEYGYMFGDGVGNVKNAGAVMSGSASADTLGVSAPDEKTLVVELTAPVPYFPSLMYFPSFYPINEAFYSGLEDGTYGTSPETFLCNGAFLLESYAPGASSMVLKRNPDYWDADRVKLAGISYQVVGSSDNALAAFKYNALDVVTIGGSQVASVESDGALSGKLAVTGAGYMWYLTFSQTDQNGQGGMLANANLRLALSNAIDREFIVDDCVMDGSLATYTAVPPQFAASATTGGDFSGDQGMFSDCCGYDVARAQGYLEAARNELGEDGFAFTLIYGSDEGDEVARVAQAIKSQVEENLPGVTLTLQSMTRAERLEKMQNDSYDVALTRWGPDYADPMTYMGMWVTGNANNYGFWSSEEYDRIITDCTTGAYASDYDARWAALHEGEALVMREAVIAPLYTKVNASLIASGVSGIEFHPVALNRVYKSASIG